MKKTYYLLLFVLLLSAVTKAQTAWVTKNLDDKLSVKFPSEPQKLTRTGIDVYTAKGKDSVVYSASVIDYEVLAHLDSATLASLKDTQEFADQMKTGMATTMTKYTLGDIKIGKWKTYTAYTISGTDNATKNTVSMQMIIIGTKMYSLSYMVPATVSTKDNEIFLGSIETLKK